MLSPWAWLILHLTKQNAVGKVYHHNLMTPGQYIPEQLQSCLDMFPI